MIPVAVSPKRNEVSGEFSVVMAKALTGKSRHIFSLAHGQFFSKFLVSLSDVYRDMDVDTVLELLKGPVHQVEVNMDALEMKRLQLFLEGRHFYEMDADIAYGLVWYYFLTGDHYLSREQERLVVLKVLQKKDWSEVERFTAGESYDELRKIIGIIASRLN